MALLSQYDFIFVLHSEKDANGEWYRYFIRGQVGEIASMRPGVDLAAPPVNPSYFVGTFSSIKYGMRSPAPR